MIVFVSYPILLFYTFLENKNEFWKTLIVPAAVFTTVSILRKIIKEQRPYDYYGIAPVIVKKSEPDSMPSRHTASAFIIAMAMMSASYYAGIIYLAIAVIISLSRIFAGVHFIKDVLVGAAISIISGIIFII